MDKNSDDLNEMSPEKLRDYRKIARKDYITRINSDRAKSISRAKFVQKADIKLAQIESIELNYIDFLMESIGMSDKSKV
jgi:hypothetical protein